MKPKEKTYANFTAKHPDSEKQKRRDKLLESVALWANYYRNNPHRFANEFLHLELKLFQKILLAMMNWSNIFVFIACRGIGKTFLIAIYCVFRCILYPGTKICIASGTRGQALNVLEKIMLELIPESPELAYEINLKESSDKSSNAKIVFKNGSYIKVVTSSDNARGNRAHILILDEFVLIKKDTIDTILKNFLSTPRHPKYLNNPKYAHLKEQNKTVYSSSACYKDHWAYQKTVGTSGQMIDDSRHSFVCGFPYHLPLKEGLFLEESILEKMSEPDFNEIKWMIENEALFWGDSDGTFFNFESMAKNRKIQFPMFPDDISQRFPSNYKVRIPNKQPGEKRLLSADLALMSSNKNKNDATSIFINQLIPTKSGRFSNNIVYSEVLEGAHTGDQALKIRKMFDQYDCDYIVLDTKGVGFGVFDALVRDITDLETGEIYPAISCYNDPEMAARCLDKNARKVIWSIAATAKFNSECAFLIREGFRNGKIRLLINDYDAEQLIESERGSPIKASEKDILMTQYLNTTLLIKEMIELLHEESNNLVRIYKKNGARKDRYSSLSYNYWVACQLEIKKKKTQEEEAMFQNNFMYRAPKIKAWR